jgi:hypothetical protein
MLGLIFIASGQWVNTKQTIDKTKVAIISILANPKLTPYILSTLKLCFLVVQPEGNESPLRLLLAFRYRAGCFYDSSDPPPKE